MQIHVGHLAFCTALLATASNLLVADYSGTVTNFALDHTSHDAYSLRSISSSSACAKNASWLTVDPPRSLVYCLDENIVDDTLGSLHALRLEGNGSLTSLFTTKSPAGPVNAAIYGSNLSSRSSKSPRGLAVAYYAGSGVGTFRLSDDGSLTGLQTFTYRIEQPTDQQDAAHPHQAVVDPSGEYLLVPDLGADLVRVFWINQTSVKIHERPSLQVKKGSGPRHVVFWNASSIAGASPSGSDGSNGNGSGKLYLYVVAELAGTVTGYAVDYLPNRSGINLTKVYESPTIVDNKEAAQRNRPAEIAISDMLQPDKRFLVVSNRLDASFSVIDPDGKTIASDSLSTFRLQANGTLAFTRLVPVGGGSPRHFSFHPDGTLVAVGLQNEHVVTLLQRDVSTGLIGNSVARGKLSDQVTNVVFI